MSLEFLHMCVADRGVQLLEREEEMCVLYAKVNVQESLICEGTLHMQALEEEICSLKMLINEEQRQISLIKKQVPCKRPLEDERALLQIQVLKMLNVFLLCECLEITEAVKVKTFMPLTKNFWAFLY